MFGTAPMAKDDLKTTREEAWVGDAVLSLIARQWILKERGKMDGEMLTRFTSNRFLSSLGNPTEVEAVIGRVYQDGGLDAAAAWIEANAMPVFAKQERNRKNH